MFSHSRQIDIRRSNVANVGRDQTHYHRDVYQTNINITIADSTPERAITQILHDLDSISQSSTSSPGTLRRGDVPAPTPRHLSRAGSAGDIAIRLIIKIVQLLVDCKEFSDANQGLKLELETLQKILSLTGLAMQAYEYTPLGRNLASNIIPVVEQCCVVLDEIFVKIDSYRQGLHPTSIGILWHQVWRSGNGMDSLRLLRLRLFTYQRLLGEFLMALNS
jgi:hypothetical protein